MLVVKNKTHDNSSKNDSNIKESDEESFKTLWIKYHDLENYTKKLEESKQELQDDYNIIKEEKAEVKAQFKEKIVEYNQRKDE